MSEKPAVMGSNIDIQFLMDPQRAEVYSSKYTCKDEKGSPDVMRSVGRGYGDWETAMAAQDINGRPGRLRPRL